LRPRFDKTLADNDIEDLVREFQMLRSLRHRNIIRLYAAYETPRKLYLVTELASGGELMKRLGSDSSVYSEDEVKKHIKTILEAVQYMHHKNSVHRDLKPENVLLSDMSEAAEIKIVDLGLSRFFEERKLMRTICGTHKYLAPELVQCDRGQLQGYDKAIDMWGIGLLTFIMLFGFNPLCVRCRRRRTTRSCARRTPSLRATTSRPSARLSSAAYCSSGRRIDSPPTTLSLIGGSRWRRRRRRASCWTTRGGR